MKFNYTFPCNKNKLKDIRVFIRNALYHANLDQILLNNITLAVDEICSNVMIHGHQCDESILIEIDIEILASQQIIIDIIDEVEFFDIINYEEPKISQIINDNRKGGLGLILVKRIMDEVKLLKKKNKYICRLVKTLIE